MATDLSRALGERLREIRHARGLLQEDVAGGMRLHGFDWTQATVAAVEAGTRQVADDERLALLYALRAVSKTSQPLALTDLVPDRSIQVGVNAWSSGTVRMLYEGRPARGDAITPGQRAAWGHHETVEAIAAGEAERRAARKLGVDASVIASAAIRLWGRGLTEERDARTSAGDRPPETLRAVRGHVTRELVEQLRPVVLEIADHDERGEQQP